MAKSDDPKDRLEEGSAEKQPLGFEQEVAPADPSLTGRRLFLKLTLLGAAASAAASMVPKAVLATVAHPVPVTPDAPPVPLPYKNSLPLSNQPATLSNDGGPEGSYLVSGTGDLYIDAGGNIFLSNIQATGTYQSGSLDVGPISIVQPAASLAGKYSGTTVAASTTVLYSDNFAKQQPATLQVNGTLSQGNSDLTVGVSFQNPGEPDDRGVIWIFRKATC